MESISFRPDAIRDATELLIDRCPQVNGLGGFVTEDFPNLIRFFMDPSNTLATFHHPFRKLSFFFSLILPLYGLGRQRGTFVTSI